VNEAVVMNDEHVIVMNDDNVLMCKQSHGGHHHHHHHQSSNYDNDIVNKVYCLCREKDDGRKMIGCDECDYWYHIKCLLLPHPIPDPFTCPVCMEVRLIKEKLLSMDDKDTTEQTMEEESTYDRSTTNTSDVTTIPLPEDINDDDNDMHDGINDDNISSIVVNNSFSSSSAAAAAPVMDNLSVDNMLLPRDN
jgi:hypothetical protein